MFRTRLTQVLVGGVAAVLVVAGIDALRSSVSKSHPSSETSSGTLATASQATVGAYDVSRCAKEQISVSIDVRQPGRDQPPVWAKRFIEPGWRQRQVATFAVGNVGSSGCYLAKSFHFSIRDRDDRQVGLWLDSAWFVGEYPPGSEKTFALPTVYFCDRPGPFHAIAWLGDGEYEARASHLSYSAVTCFHGRES